MKILYVIPRMTYGGGMPAILTEVKTIRQIIADFTATVVTLESGLSTDMMTEAIANGLKVLLAPSSFLLKKLISSADLTVVHYWNCPSMFRFLRLLADSSVPHRLCLSVRVNGCTLPQVVPEWVYSIADALIQLHPRTPAIGLRPGIEKQVIPSLIRLSEQLSPPGIPSFNTFRMFHAGTLNYFKTHPQLIPLHEGLRINDYSFDIWGTGMDKVFEDDLTQANDVMYKGFSRSMFEDMAPYHLLCNPQTALSYGSFDKIMRESQWMGKPVIVLKNSFVADHIIDGVNGIIAEDEQAYRACLESIAAQPAVYKRLAESTLQYTRTHYQLINYVESTVQLYRRALQRPPKVVTYAHIPEKPDDAVLDGLGHWKTLLLEQPELLSNMEIKYALRCEGGLIHYYKYYPDNTALYTRITQLLALEQSIA
ncbi:glycosyltransferase [Spirosoma sp. KNUC1025]|uniref:glycosyltransferase n=1 Tax=Spirosoma sp. KNUC1025 TaxID=2894082 RepID=UPI00386F2EDB|nr:glycosyltransferase [Spirosoma sp. KNUC1025]